MALFSVAVLPAFHRGKVNHPNTSNTAKKCPNQPDTGAITVWFAHTTGGLKSLQGKPLTGFEVAFGDRQWKAAEARIGGDTVVASSPDVPMPAAVLYAWKDFPQCSLGNGAGLPASLIRSDDWPPAQK